jgi:cytochrome P450
MPTPPAVDMRDPAFRNDPHTLLHRLRERGRVERDVMGIWLATHHADSSTGLDTVLPAGGLVFFMTGATNSDPAVFAEPDRFDIMRSPNPPSRRPGAS